MHRAFAERLFTDNDGLANALRGAVLKTAGNNFTGAGAAVVDQHDDRERGMFSPTLGVMQ